MQITYLFLVPCHSGVPPSNAFRCFRSGCKRKARVSNDFFCMSFDVIFLFYSSHKTVICVSVSLVPVWMFQVMVLLLKLPSASSVFKKNKGKTRAP